MKKTIFLLMLMVGMIMSITSCSSDLVDQGSRGLVIKRPYIFGTDGVEVANEGRVYYAWSSNLVPINVRPDRVKEDFDDLTSSDRTSVYFDIYFTMQPLADQVDVLYTNFGLDWYAKNVEQEFRNMVRDKAKTYDMNQLCNDPKTSSEICAYLQSEGEKMLKKLGIPVKLLAVNMSAVNPPQAVIVERNATAAARQREQTINQNTKNEVQRQQTEKERAIADKMYQTQMNLSTEQYMELQRLQTDRVAYNKCTNVTLIKGNVPTVNNLR